MMQRLSVKSMGSGPKSLRLSLGWAACEQCASRQVFLPAETQCPHLSMGSNFTDLVRLLGGLNSLA